MKSVAIVGAGPAGLVAARYLKSEGFDVTLFDRSKRIGGHWSADPEHSGIWPNLRTNTSRLMTSFSDLRPSPGAIFLSAEEVRTYLERYAQQFDLTPNLLLRHQVVLLSRHSDGFTVTYTTPDGRTQNKDFSHVLVAAGRHRLPVQARISGLHAFTGRVSHSLNYRGARPFQGQTAVVAGCGVSALEIATELAHAEARVIVSSRRQRYIMNKIVAGVPVDHSVMTRSAALSVERRSPRDVCDDLQRLLLRTAGDPRSWGTLPPPGNVLEAGVTLNQNFLSLVADGRIACRPWIQSIAGNSLRFEDGSEETADTILLGTGYRPDLGFLSPELQTLLRVQEERLTLFKHTFHPAVPNLAFLGFYDLMGPYFPVFELQARWIAYSWSGACPLASPQHMETQLAPLSALPMPLAALTFAREAGVEPDLTQFPALRETLLMGPLSPISFRLTGRDCLANAADLVLQDGASVKAETPAATPRLNPVRRGARVL